jgi:uncharacterized protein (DUF362 family)
MPNQEKKGLSRRGFLGASVGAVVTVGMTSGCSGSEPSSGDATSGGSSSGAGGTSSGGAGGGAEAGGGGSSSGGQSSGGSSSGGTDGGDGGAPPKVCLVRDNDVVQAVRAAVAAVGGLPDLTGKTVLLKPNLNSNEGPPTSPHPEVMRAAIRLAKERGAARVIVGDRSNPAYDTIQAMTAAGIHAVAVAEGAEPMNFNGMPTRRVTPTGATNWPNGFSTYAIILDEVDYIINCACCKHHSMANYTMAMKAWMGIIVQNDRNTAHSDLGNCLPELHLAVKEDMVILDATKALLTAGPSLGGLQASPGIVVAATDAVAADVTGVCIMKHYLAQAKRADRQIDDYTVWTQPQIVRALALGNGWIRGRQEYTYTSRGISEIDAIMRYLDA